MSAYFWWKLLKNCLKISSHCCQFTMSPAIDFEVDICRFRCSVEHMAAKRGSDAFIERGIPIKDLSSNCSWCQVTNRFLCLFARISPALHRSHFVFHYQWSVSCSVSPVLKMCQLLFLQESARCLWTTGKYKSEHEKYREIRDCLGPIIYRSVSSVILLECCAA